LRGQPVTRTASKTRENGMEFFIRAAPDPLANVTVSPKDKEALSYAFDQLPRPAWNASLL
jgi:hypothetical protein